jgi:hypothetical protein
MTTERKQEKDVVLIRYINASEPGAEFSAWKPASHAPENCEHSSLHAWWMRVGSTIGAALDEDEASNWELQNSNCSVGGDGFMWLTKDDDALIVQWRMR